VVSDMPKGWQLPNRICLVYPNRTRAPDFLLVARVRPVTRTWRAGGENENGNRLLIWSSGDPARSALRYGRGLLGRL